MADKEPGTTVEPEARQRVFVSAQCKVPACQAWFLLDWDVNDLHRPNPVSGCKPTHTDSVRRARIQKEKQAGMRKCLGCGTPGTEAICDACLKVLKGVCQGKQRLKTAGYARLVALKFGIEDYQCPVCRDYHTGRWHGQARADRPKEIVASIEAANGRPLLDHLAEQWYLAGLRRGDVKRSI